MELLDAQRTIDLLGTREETSELITNILGSLRDHKIIDDTFTSWCSRINIDSQISLLNNYLPEMSKFSVEDFKRLYESFTI